MPCPGPAPLGAPAASPAPSPSFLGIRQPPSRCRQAAGVSPGGKAPNIFGDRDLVTWQDGGGRGRDTAALVQMPALAGGAGYLVGPWHPPFSRRHPRRQSRILGSHETPRSPRLCGRSHVHPSCQGHIRMCRDTGSRGASRCGPAPPAAVPPPPPALSRALAAVSVDLCAALGAVTLPASCCPRRAARILLPASCCPLWDGSGTSATAARLEKPQPRTRRGERHRWEMLQPPRQRAAWPVPLPVPLPAQAAPLPDKAGRAP